jgi:Pyruvate phosphate dikinase, AMP/ATP-binding domain
LLAKNRGTPNISTASIDLLPKAAELSGKLVRMDASSNGKITLSEVSLAEATKFWEAHRRPVLEVPAYNDAGFALVDFQNGANGTTINAIGSKASNYAELRRILGDTSTRPGFALTFSHYLRIVKASGADGAIASLIARRAALTPDEVDTELAAIRKTIQGAPADALTESVAAVRLAIARVPGLARIRLRSSTNSEDLPQFNGAGLYEACLLGARNFLDPARQGRDCRAVEPGLRK